MPTEVILPRVDMDMTAGKIVRWYVDEGAEVKKGALLFDLETSKAAMEIEAPASGVLRGVVPVTDEEIPVGQVVGWIYGPDEVYEPAVAAVPVKQSAGAPAKSTGGAQFDAQQTVQSVVVGTGVAATPLARRLARERGIDLSALAGSGVRGRIQGGDVPRPAPLWKPAPQTGTVAESRAVHRVWLRTGAGVPTVMLHGFGSELDSWRPLVIAAPAAGPVLAVDLPAHGKSVPISSSNLAGLADAVAGALAEEGVTSGHLLGHSLGGAVATLLAARAEFAARSLLLISSGGLGSEIKGAFIDGFLAAQTAESLRPVLAMAVADPERLPRDFIAASLRPRQREGYLAGLTALAATLFPNRQQAFSIRDRLGALSMPKRLIFGSEDGIIPPTHASGLAGSVGVHLFPGIGHLPQVEALQDVASIWLEVIRSVG